MDLFTQTLARLTDAADAVGANLVRLESEPTVALLDGSDLTGRTRDAWNEASATRATLWSRYGQLGGLLAEVTVGLGGRSPLTPERAAALLTQLTGASIQVDVSDDRLDRRSLLDAEPSTTMCTPDELLTAMSESFDRVQGIVAAAGVVWETMVPRLAGARVSVDELRRDAAELGGSSSPLEAVTRDLDRLATLAVSDPLWLDVKDLDRIEAEIAMLRRDTEDVLTLRREHGRRLGEASELLRDVEALAQRAFAELASTRARIVPLNVPSVEAADADELARRLDAIRNEDGSDWRRRGAALAGWLDDAEQHRARATRVVAACDDALAMRDELRGRLEAYRAVAHATGLAEDVAGHDVYLEARDALFHAPTDLEAAARLVAGYQHVIAPSRPAPEGEG
jgi:hypothetical protein